MSLSRRNFLRVPAAAGFAVPTIIRAALRAVVTKGKETHMQITRVGSQPSSKGPGDWFTGTVRIDPLFSANDRAESEY